MQGSSETAIDTSRTSPDSDSTVSEIVLSNIRALQRSHSSGADFLAHLGNHTVKVFLDTGAEVNLLKASSIESLPATDYQYMPLSLARVKGIDGSQLDVSARVRFSLQVGQTRLPMEAIVVSGVGFPGDLLLGRPTMCAYGMRLNMEEKVLVFKNHVVPLHFNSWSADPAVRTVQEIHLNADQSAPKP